MCLHKYLHIRIIHAMKFAYSIIGKKSLHIEIGNLAIILFGLENKFTDRFYLHRVRI